MQTQAFDLALMLLTLVSCGCFQGKNLMSSAADILLCAMVLAIHATRPWSAQLNPIPFSSAAALSWNK